MPYPCRRFPVFCEVPSNTISPTSHAQTLELEYCDIVGQSFETHSVTQPSSHHCTYLAVLEGTPPPLYGNRHRRPWGVQLFQGSTFWHPYTCLVVDGHLGLPVLHAPPSCRYQFLHRMFAAGGVCMTTVSSRPWNPWYMWWVQKSEFSC